MASLPSCLVRGCEAAASEGMLCRGHLALWRAAGRPRDVEAWALKHAQKRDASGELRVVPVRFPKPQRPEKLLTPEEHQRLWASVPDEAFEA